MDTTEAQSGVNTNLNMTSPQARRAHGDAQDSDAPQCKETDISEKQQRVCWCRPRWYPHVEVEEEASDVCTQGRKPTHQGGVGLEAKRHGELKKHGSFKQQPRCRDGKLETKTADEALEAKGRRECCSSQSAE